jgi:hypothetical protein
MAYCPLYGESCDYYNNINNSRRFQPDNRAGTADRTIIDEWNTIAVDGMSAPNPYAEQYTAWHMLNSPGTCNRAVLTKVNLVNF